MFWDLNYRQDEGALEDLEKDGDKTFQKIRQRQGCEKTGNMPIYSRKKKKKFPIRIQTKPLNDK